MSLHAQYTEDDKAVALAYYAACGKNQRKTSRDCKIPLATLQRWIGGGAVNEAVTRKAVIKKGELSDRLDALAHLVMDGIAEKLPEASFAQSMTGLGIAVDKMRLLREQPTEIVDDASLSDTERAARITAILDRARTRRDGQATETETAH